jgi:hypothetical protein
MVSVFMAARTRVAARTDLLRRQGRLHAAAQAYMRALDFCSNAPERRFLERRLTEVSGRNNGLTSAGLPSLYSCSVICLDYRPDAGDERASTDLLFAADRSHSRSAALTLFRRLIVHGLLDGTSFSQVRTTPITSSVASRSACSGRARAAKMPA